MFNRNNIILLLIILLSCVPGFIISDQLPDQIPSHWNINGEVDDYSSKWITLVGLPLLNLVLFFLLLLFPKIDPKKENYKKFERPYTMFRWTFHLFFVALYFFMIYNAWSMEKGQESMDASTVILIFMPILFIVIGNYMSRVRHNYFVGIRTPWTLSNEEVWRKTHRLGGKVFVIIGFLGWVTLLFEPMYRFIIFIGGLVLGALFLTVYSYFVFQKVTQEKE